MLFYIYINIDLNKIHISWNRSVDCFKGQSSSSDVSILMSGLHLKLEAEWILREAKQRRQVSYQDHKKKIQKENKFPVDYFGHWLCLESYIISRNSMWLKKKRVFNLLANLEKQDKQNFYRGSLEDRILEN